MAGDTGEARLIIEGVNLDNKKFRPADWVERIATLWAQFGEDHRLRYSPSIYPCVVKGEKCLVVTKGLQSHDPATFNFILKFAEQNRLRVQEDRRASHDPPSDERREEAWDYQYFMSRR